jgi:hypothetical protein
LSTKIITKCCPDCGSTTGMHNSWCKVHLTPVNKKDVEKCVIHNIKLDKFINGKLGCLLCWKNKGEIEELKKALELDSYSNDATVLAMVDTYKKILGVKK